MGLDIETNTISGHEAAITDIESQIQALRAKQLVHHAAAEVLRKAVPIPATPSDQVLQPGNADGLVKWAAGLPEAAKTLILKTWGKL